MLIFDYGMESFFFKTARGDYPVKGFIGEHDLMIRSKIALSILLLKNQEPFLKPPYIKKLQDIASIP